MLGLTFFELSYALLWLLALVLVPVSVVLLYLHAQLQARSGRAFPSGSQLIGRKMPVLAAKDLASGVARRIEEIPGRVHAVLLLMPDCGSCVGLMSELRSSSPRDIVDIRLQVLCMGRLNRCQNAVAEIQSAPVLVLDTSDDESADFWRTGAPALLIVNELGTIIDVRRPSALSDIAQAINNVMRGGDHSPTAHGHVSARASATAA